MGFPSMNRHDSSGYYDGSQLLAPLAGQIGLPVDQVNFVVCQLASVALAFFFRYALHPRHFSAETRHGVSLTLGMAMVVFCFGRQALHLGCLATIGYVIVMTASPKISHRLVLIIAMLYLSGVHIKRQIYSYGSASIDISGPLMVMTQKVTNVAFSLHDGLARRADELNASQRQQAIRRLPSPLEYFGYLFHFPTLMVGPAVLFAEYADFIDGRQFVDGKRKEEEEKERVGEPSAVAVVVRKMAAGFLCCAVFVKLAPVFPISRILEDDFVLETSTAEKVAYLVVATTLVRTKYYYAWLVADAVCNAAGLGFNGYDDAGRPRWDRTTNVDIVGFEFGLSLKDSIDHWNKFTNRWLRFVVYDRTTRARTLLTYVLSAVWHGFYPGYYLTFLGGALCTLASRAVRRGVRPLCLGRRPLKLAYDLATFATTRVVMGYLSFPFVLLELAPSLRLYTNMYFWLHLLSLAAVLVLPVVLPAPSRRLEPHGKITSTANGSH